MDSEEVFACSLRESYCPADYTIARPPLLSHTPDFEDRELAEDGIEVSEVQHTPVLYPLDGYKTDFLEEEMFPLDNCYAAQTQLLDSELSRPRNNGSFVIQDLVDKAFSTVPQDNYRIWLERF